MDALAIWLLSDPLDRQKLALLVFCMAAMQVLVAQLAWRVQLTGSGDGRLALMWRSWPGRGVIQILRLFYHIGVPLVVLWRAARHPDLYRAMGIATTYVGRWHPGLLLLGLEEPQHALHLGIGVAAGGAMLGLLLVIWAWYVRVVLGVALGRPGTRESAMVPALPFWGALRQALYMQFLWALYRGTAFMLSGNRLWAAFISLALVAVPWLLDPCRRRDLFGARGYLVVQDWLFALYTAFLSITVQALWLLILMHALWIWFSGQALAHLSRSAVSPSTSQPCHS